MSENCVDARVCFMLNTFALTRPLFTSVEFHGEHATVIKLRLIWPPSVLGILSNLMLRCRLCDGYREEDDHDDGTLNCNSWSRCDIFLEVECLSVAMIAFLTHVHANA